jgi:putative acetyltransferase
MEITTQYKDKTRDIIAMFQDTFTHSEGPEAGEEIRRLVADMLSSLPSETIHVFSAIENGEVLASIIFTPMTYPEEERSVVILSPVAVSTAHQGKGIGQRLIAHALESLHKDGVDVALTYGDINFYSRVGFAQITQADAQAPQPLQYPEGWLGQSLAGGPFTPLKGPSECVGPLNHPELW